jgi:ArsR family transcriptional regulator
MKVATKKTAQMSEKEFRRIAKTVADPRRFEILKRIADTSELACQELRERLPITAATLSHHVKELHDVGLIEIRKESKCIHMKLRREVWKKYLAHLNEI